VLIPCIDLQDGVAVQLVHGRKKELEVSDTLGLLEKFQHYRWLHIIDLDAAMGKASNAVLTKELCDAAKRKYGMRVRIGGGIRSTARAREILQWKPDQIIVGSAAFRANGINTRFLASLAKLAGKKRVVIALDTAKGRITVHGWRKRLALRAEAVIPQLEKFCGGFLCTDVDREGTMSGANLDWFRGLRRLTRLPIIAAGGIKSRREVSALDKIGIDAAVGMALYRNRLR
jgi:phosphoribosylformimino-5-aminoimidazole carboxamide ribotide isomerase